MTIDEVTSFPGISAKAYEHPADRAATAALHAIPLLDGLLKRLTELGLERRYRQLLLGNAVRLGPEQIPAVWQSHTAAASVLDLQPPALYVTQTPFVNTMTVGANIPVVIVNSSLIASYEPEEVYAVLAHELGHVLSEHYYYNTVLGLLAQPCRVCCPPRCWPDSPSALSTTRYSSGRGPPSCHQTGRLRSSSPTRSPLAGC